MFSTECWSPELNAFQNPSLDKCSLRALKTISTPWDMFQGFLMIWCLGHTQTLHGAGVWVLSGPNVWAMRKVEPTAAQASFLSSLLPFLFLPRQQFSPILSRCSPHFLLQSVSLAIWTRTSCWRLRDGAASLRGLA